MCAAYGGVGTLVHCKDKLQMQKKHMIGNNFFYFTTNYYKLQNMIQQKLQKLQKL